MGLSVSLVGANGDTISFDDVTYSLTTGVKGFGIPATNLRIQEGAGDGGIFRNSKRGIREMDLPITIFGADRATTEAAVRRLANVLRGQAILQIFNPDENVTYSMGVYYAAGGETVFGGSANNTFCSWLVTVQAPDPFWYSNASQSFTITSGQSGRGLLPRLSNLRVVNSQAIGTINISNTAGDVASWPTWKLYGPMDSCQILKDGVGFTYNAAIADGEVITIDTKNSLVTNLAGSNVYSNLSSAPKFFQIPAGNSSIYVFGSNATANTQIVCSYSPRREVVH